MLFSTPGPGILLVHERQSRRLLALPHPDFKAEPTAHSLAQMLKPLPPHLRQSITFDNGREFSRHQHLASQLGIDTYFCDRHAP